VAGVFDGEAMRVFVDGELAGDAEASGTQPRSGVDLHVGAQSDTRGRRSAFFAGRIDEVRVSKTARYGPGAFKPGRRHEPDGDTVVLLHLDRSHGPFVRDASASEAHGCLRGGAELVPVAGPDAEEQGALLEKLDGLDAVGGKHVGFSATESEFYVIYRRLRWTGEKGLPETLLASEKPIRRAMGLCLLVARDGGQAVPALLEAIDDRGPVDVNNYGCVVRAGSVGSVAHGLLGLRHWLTYEGEYEGWLPREELLALDLEILGRDDTVRIHEDAAETLAECFDDRILPRDLDALRKRFPKVPLLRLVKALGRIRESNDYYDPEHEYDEWILGLAADRDLPEEVRLAAASSLAYPFYGEYRDPRPFPADRLEGLPDDAVAVIHRDYEAIRQLQEHEEDCPAFRSGHVLALGEMSIWELGEKGKEILPLDAETVEVLMRVTERLPEWQPEWNTLGDGLYQLEALVRELGDPLRRQIGEDRYALVVERMEAAIAADE
jgi:hypothetical protein